MTNHVDDRRRWLALVVLCLGALMIVLDTTIVNVALPSIRASLGFSEATLAWVVNAYLLTFGGFLLLGGRLGDLFGHRRIFMIGITIFTLASLSSGLANSQGVLIAARGVQGLGGAVVSAVALSLLMNLFPEPDARARAMGYFGFVSAGGGSVGVLLGGLLTSLLNWHWIFLVNLPIGLVVFLLSQRLLPASEKQAGAARLDVAGAVSVTAALILAVYAIVNGNDDGWGSLQTTGLLSAAALLFGLFVWIERRVKAPLVPLGLFKLRNVTTANIIGVLWAAAMFAWFFLSALYMQLVLGFGPLQVGLAFLPANLIMAVFSFSLSARLVMRFGIQRPLVVGLFLAAGGLLLFGRAPVGGNFVVDVLPAMLLLGLGAGIEFNPVLLAAMNDVDETESGLASGVVNTSFMMGGALGLAILASLAAYRTASLSSGGADHLAALDGGYQIAFLVGALFAGTASALGATLLRIPMSATQGNGEPAPDAETGQRKVVLLTNVSLDGFMAGLDGEPDWGLASNEEEWDYVNELLNGADGALLSRVFYQDFKEYWPGAAEDPSSSKYDKEFAKWIEETPKVVFSNTLDKVDWKNSRLVRENVAQEIARLKGQPGCDLLLFGGAGIAQSFMQLGLIDEYRIKVNPVVLGSGRLLFKDPKDKRNLKLVASKTFSSGAVSLHYQLDRKESDNV
jgi:EmrB/QacA subfamily drug resistance transporter